MKPERNRYTATCYRCGGTVHPDQGVVSHLRLDQKQAWQAMAGLRNVLLIEHDACAERYAGTFIHHIYQPDDGISK